VYRLQYDARPWTTNTERASNRYERARFTKEWRSAFTVLAKAHKVKPMHWATIIVEPHQKGGRLQDAGGCAPAAKAAIDGLVDAGVFPDDSGEFVRTITYLRPTRGTSAMALWIMGESA